MAIKKNYEVALMQHVVGDCPDDYESMEFVSCDNYREAVKCAKDFSMFIGKVEAHGYQFKKYEPNSTVHHPGLDEGLACVQIVCYCETDISSYEQIFHERYRDGKKDGERYYFD